MSDAKLVFGLDLHDKIVHVLDVPRGLACAARCPVCNGALIARQGSARVPHFAHVDTEPCRDAAMKALRLFATQVLLSRPEMSIDDAALENLVRRCDRLDRTEWEQEILAASCSRQFVAMAAKQQESPRRQGQHTPTSNFPRTDEEWRAYLAVKYRPGSRYRRR